MAATNEAPRRSEELVERIEQVAATLFIRDGYHGVSYLDIAKELGITHSNVHYYYRNKHALADAVLRRAAAEMVASTSRIWRDPQASLAEKFVRMRDWIYAAYLQFNPGGKGGRPWGLITRFSMDADALTPEMRQVIRATLKKQENDIRLAVELAVRRREFRADVPVDAIALQIMSVMHNTGQISRYTSGFARLDELMMWTMRTLYLAFGDRPPEVAWPEPDVAGAPALTPALPQGGKE